MRHVTNWLLAAAMALLMSRAEALPLGNPWEAGLLTQGVVCTTCEPTCDEGSQSWRDYLSVRLGYYGDFVFNRHLVAQPNGGEIRRSLINTNAAYVALNFCDRFDLFTTVGATYFNLFFTQRYGPYSEIAELRTETDLSWSLGVRGTLWQCGCLAVGGEVQYFLAQPEVNNEQIYLFEPFYFEDEEFKYSEWQAGLGLSYGINLSSFTLIPYAGVKWASARVSLNETLRLDDARVLVDLKTERHFGYAIGFTLLGCRRFAFTLEKRFRDEDAYYINAQFRI